ncbi:2-amino-4-oxopentanoate thiolase subunit OrtB [Fusibacter paucivorans]|uniref:2-amino-4-oxopentanoate thiolase subunit OrtB n=1 Tax=Fusibacter paucivorans TaxID=76009 RepID=UPI0031B82624
MTNHNDNQGYDAVMKRRNEIMKRAVGIDYAAFEFDNIGFDYERMMREVGYTLSEVIAIQRSQGVGNTPMIKLNRLTELARKLSPEGMGAQLFLKDEASNPSGSFKARRAAVAVYQAKKLGYEGVVAATSGNYGAAVASQAAMQGLKCIIVQETYDSKGQGQPEIIEKARKCEAFGAEVVQLTVGPELFYQFLIILEQTGYFNASLYTPYGIAGIESLGAEIADQMMAMTGRYPDAVVCTNAGGGNLTGTARGLQKRGADATKIIGASVDLSGLHMASDRDFNRKSFTTGHTGFGLPFATMPDRSDVPRSAARPLRYMDSYVTVKQGEVFYMTEALAQLEGMERGPAGNVSLAAAFALAMTMPRSATIVVQETEYTGAGKHIQPQLSFARQNGIEIRFGHPDEEVPGNSIILPSHPSQMKARPLELVQLRKRLVENLVFATAKGGKANLSDREIAFLADESRFTKTAVEKIIFG